MDKEEMRKEMVKEPEDKLEEMFPRVKEILWLDDEGNVYSEIDETNLDGGSRIGLLLIGRMYAEFFDINDSAVVSNSEIADQLGIASDVVSARISELKSDGFVSSPAQGEYEFQEQSIGRFLDELEFHSPE